MNEKSKEIARRNDIARKLGLEVVMTVDAAKLPKLEGLLRYIRAYDNFTEKNDPYEAHDMGFFTWEGVEVIWKFDYFNEQLTNCVDPLAPNCKRVLTVMLAKEY